MKKCDKCRKLFSYPLHPMRLSMNFVAKICGKCYGEWSDLYIKLGLGKRSGTDFNRNWNKEFTKWLSGKETVVFT